MNPKEARTRKAEQAAKQLREIIAAAIDALSANQGVKAYHLLRRGIESGAPPARTGEVAPVSEFDEGFRRLCLTTGYRAGYVVASPDGTVRSGGDPAVTHAIDTAFAEAQERRAAEVEEDPHGSEAKDQRERQE